MKKVYSGFSLVEVLVSLLILSLILLGFDAMEIFAFRENRNTYYFSVAENQLNSMISRLHVMQSPDELPAQLTIWNKQNQEVLPEGKGEVMDLLPFYTISIFWDEKKSLSTRVKL